MEMKCEYICGMQLVCYNILLIINVVIIPQSVLGASLTQALVMPVSSNSFDNVMISSSSSSSSFPSVLL